MYTFDINHIWGQDIWRGGKGRKKRWRLWHE